MFWRTSPTKLEGARNDAIRELNSLEIGSEDYLKVLDVVTRLYGVKEETQSVSRDTLALIGANLLGIILIIRHEHVNVITSRAMNMVIKPR